MNIKKIFYIQLFFVLLTNCMQEAKLGSSWHFNAKILKNKKTTKNKLLQEGFQQISFTSTNNMNIVGLFREKKDATCTIIFSHGFCPGGKELFAPFVKLAPKYCNLLFLDLRSAGESDGPNMFWKMRNYGKTDYQDIINAIHFVNKKTSGKPIIIFGWCSGAFNSATALIHLKDDLKALNIQGLIFDSGFGSIIEMAHVPFIDLDKKYIPKFVLTLYRGDKKKAKQSYICTFSTFFCKSLLHGLSLFVKPPIKKREPKTNLYDKIQNISIPIFFIHAEDDEYAPWQHTQKLVEITPQKSLWLIKPGKSRHATNHLKQKEQYQQKLHQWLQSIFTKNQLT